MRAVLRRCVLAPICCGNATAISVDCRTIRGAGFESFKAAQVVVRSARSRGTIDLRAASSGLSDAHAQIEARWFWFNDAFFGGRIPA